MLPAQHPQSGLPLRSGYSLAALQRQHHAHRRIETALEYFADAFPLQRIRQLILHRLDVDRKLPLLMQMVEGIFKRWRDVIRIRHPGACASVLAKSSASGNAKVVSRLHRAPATRDSSTAARHRSANNKPEPSAAKARPDTICLARNAATLHSRSARARRSSNRPASSRFSGPSAAVFHSSPSMLSIETKVGSPPMVKRMSPLQISRST